MPTSAASSPAHPDASCHSRRQWLAAALALPALAANGRARAQGESRPPWQPWPMPGVRQLDLPAAPLPGSAAARQHRVMVYEPEGAVPAGGHPVIYVLDGNLMFPLVAQLVHNRGARGQALRGGSAIVVGLGHAMPAGGAVHDLAARTYDYTPPGEGVGPDARGRAQGGADRFLDFVAGTLQPLLQSELPVDARQQTLLGHSYGGLCTLHALFTRPGMFRHHVAASPSLWWGGGAVLRECRAFIARHGAGGTPLPGSPAMPLSLHLSQGGKELEPRVPGATSDPGREAAALQARALGSTADLPEMLKAVNGLRTCYTVWPGADHGGAMPFACMQAVQIALAAA